MLTVSSIPHPFKMARNQGHGIEDFSRKMAATALMNMETGCDIAETEGYYENSGGDDGTVPISAIAKPDIESPQAEVHGDVDANDENTSTDSSSEKSGDTIVEATSLNNKAVEEAVNHTLDKDFSNNEAVEEAKIEDDVVDYGTAEVNDTLDIKDFSNNEEVEEEKFLQQAQANTILLVISRITQLNLRKGRVSTLKRRMKLLTRNLRQGWMTTMAYHQKLWFRFQFILF